MNAGTESGKKHKIGLKTARFGEARKGKRGDTRTELT